MYYYYELRVRLEEPEQIHIHYSPTTKPQICTVFTLYPLLMISCDHHSLYYTILHTLYYIFPKIGQML